MGETNEDHGGWHNLQQAYTQKDEVGDVDDLTVTKYWKAFAQQWASISC